MSAPLVVLKFGSSVLSKDEDFGEAVHEIYRHFRQGRRVVAVVSAVGTATERLLARARGISERPSPAALAALLATGEAVSASLLALALDRAGVPGTLLDPAEIGLSATGPALDAEPDGVDAARILRLLDERRVAVVPGFFGRAREGGIALFGRGGSDLTAIVLAKHLGAATCRLLKDVDGIYESNPAARGAEPARYESLTHEDALRLSSRVVQEKALRFAERHGLEFEVGACGEDGGTRVGRGPTRRRASALPPPQPLRVTLLGLGTVGLGVYRLISARPDRFEVVAVAVREPARHARRGIPPGRLFSDPWKALRVPSDLVVEAIGGLEPAAALLAEALDAGRDVVTANKTVVAERGASLERRAARHGRRFLCSASVGGGAPVLEAVARQAAHGRILRIDGVLNGTSNYVLERIMEGASLSEAVTQARRLGLAESDPSDDLEGVDTARKLAIVARLAFGVRLDPDAIPRQGIPTLGSAEIRDGLRRGQRLRLLASCLSSDAGVEARVAPVWLDQDHPFANCRSDQNAVRIECQDGTSAFVDGRGAGAWPTAESLVADLLDLWREHATRSGQGLVRLRGIDEENDSSNDFERREQA